jgi:outer membrane biosynthesis protein TonB
MPTPLTSSSLFRVGSVLALVLVLAACTKGGQFDPIEMFSNDMFDTKKKVTGEREPLFPNGVPGTTTGVPADLVKGYQAPPEQAEATEPPPTAEAAKPKPKPKPKPKLAAAPAQPQQQRQQDSVWNQKPPPPKRISVGPGSQPAAVAPQQAAPLQPASPPAAQPAQPAWPNPPVPGTSSQ